MTCTAPRLGVGLNCLTCYSNHKQFLSLSILGIFSSAFAGSESSQGDPVADHLRRLGRARGAHVVDAGESSVASYVTYAEYLPTNGHKHRVLIVARDEDLGKWTAAFSGKPYYRGDFDACPNFAEYDYVTAEPLNVYVCSDECMRRHWALDEDLSDSVTARARSFRDEKHRFEAQMVPR